jgi:hypothetical protein
MTQKLQFNPMNYSPQPLSTYRWRSGESEYGPATSALLTTQAAWNLAYLSHDYANVRVPPDPMFTVHVRKTTQVRLDGSGGDLTGMSKGLVGELLLLPAPRFVYLIKHHPVLPQLPMFKSYGQQWLEVIEKRSRICVSDSHVDKLPDIKEEDDLFHMVLAVIEKAKSGA